MRPPTTAQHDTQFSDNPKLNFRAIAVENVQASPTASDDVTFWHTDQPAVRFVAGARRIHQAADQGAAQTTAMNRAKLRDPLWR